MNKVSIVIPNWNGAEKLKSNLPKVLKVRVIDEVIISDDASTDQSVEVIKREFPEVKLIERKTNSGFSSNVNNGFKIASGELIFLLNSDAVPDPDCIEKVLPLFKNKKVFSVGFNTGGSWSWGYFKNGFFWHHQADETPKEVHETLWASGGSAIFRKSIWDELGGMDELMNPFYEEDVDIGYRAWKRGYINLWAPSAKVEHYKQTGVIEENFSKEEVSRVAQRNQLIFIWKNIGDSDLVSQHIWTLIRMLLTQPKYWLVFLSAASRLAQIFKKRKLEKIHSKTSDKEILGRFPQDPQA